VGHGIGRREREKAKEDAEAGFGLITTAIFGLFGLMVAFTFTGAASRIDERRDLIVEEANSIGTAWLRIDLLPEGEQETLRDLMRRYTDARIAAYRGLPDEVTFMAEFARAAGLQGEIWTEAIKQTSVENGSSSAKMLLLPALNAMFDIVTTRQAALTKHPPLIIYIMIVFLALIASMLAGYSIAGWARPGIFHVVAFPTIVALVLNLIINLEHPRLGVVRVNNADAPIVDVRASMGG
jgi:hypothetical protein